MLSEPRHPPQGKHCATPPREAPRAEPTETEEWWRGRGEGGAAEGGVAFKGDRAQFGKMVRGTEMVDGGGGCTSVNVFDTTKWHTYTWVRG